MTINIYSGKRLAAAGAAIAVLSGALSGCTPLNSSADKALLRQRLEGGTLAMSPNGVSRQAGLPSETIVERISAYSTRLMNAGDFISLEDRLIPSDREERDPKAPAPWVVIFTEAQLKEFRENRKVTLVLRDPIPAKIVVSVNVSLPRSFMARPDFSGFATELRRFEDGHWELSVSRRTDSEKSSFDEAILKSLDGLMISDRLAEEEPSSPNLYDQTPSGIEGPAGMEMRRPTLKPLGLEQRIRPMNSVRSLEASKRLMVLISSSQAL